MGLDTDDIVALAMDIPLIVLAILFIAAMFFMKSHDVFKELIRIILKSQTNPEEQDKPLLELIVGEKAYEQYMEELKAYCIEKYNEKGSKYMSYEEEYALTEEFFNQKDPKPYNEVTNKEVSFEEWYQFSFRKFIYDYNDTHFFRPSFLWHAIARKIDSKEL